MYCTVVVSAVVLQRKGVLPWPCRPPPPDAPPPLLPVAAKPRWLGLKHLNYNLVGLESKCSLYTLLAHVK